MVEEKKVEDLSINKDKEKTQKITVKIPEKILKAMNEFKTKKVTLMQQFFQIATQEQRLHNAKHKLTATIESTGQSIRKLVERAGKKLKLKKRSNYGWRFNGEDSFVGVPIPPKPESKKIEEKK